jgi:hypothetical protein
LPGKPYTYFLLLVLFVQCRKENAFDCFKSNGKQVTQARAPGEFTHIEVYNKFDVTIVSGSEYLVEITSGSNLLSNISTAVTNNVLKIENRNTCNFVRGYKQGISIRITVPRVDRVYNYGVGPITFDDGFAQDSLFVRAENSGDIHVNGTFRELRTSSHGNGDIYLSGSAENLLIYTYGTNYTHAENFSVSKQLYVSTYSIGDAYFNLTGTGHFQYYIWTDGNIYYRGKPGIIENLGEDKASGRLIEMD